MNFQNQYLCSKYFIRGLVLLACLALTLPVMAGWSEKQKITSVPPGVGAQFGNAVAISGNTMVVGASGHSATPALATAGAAFVYELNGTAWTYKETLLADDAAPSDNFGYSVAISGDTIVVGAYHDDSPSADGGSAYVFYRDNNSTTPPRWKKQQKLTETINGSVADDEFGNSVGIIGNIIVVGAHHAKVMGNSDAGSAYIFQRSGTVWSTNPQILTPTATANQTPNGPVLPIIGGDLFGESVAISGNFIAVGAKGNDNPETRAGAVYVFVLQSGGSYVLQPPKLIIPGGTGGDNFGNAVALEGNTLVAGAREDAQIGQMANGAAYVFEFNGGTWTSQGKLVASDTASSDRFGWSVAVSSNVIAVGARDDDNAMGSAYVFTRSGSAWTEIQKLVLAPAERKNGDRFGESVALSLGHLVVGAAAKDLKNSQGTSIGQGAAYYFTEDSPIFFPVATVAGIVLFFILTFVVYYLIRPKPRS